MSRALYSRLEGHQVVPCADVLEWDRWFETADRIVARTEVQDWVISTAFLGIDHSHGSGPPLYFETMSFHESEDSDMARYSTWDEAKVGHAEIVARVAGRLFTQKHPFALHVGPGAALYSEQIARYNVEHGKAVTAALARQ